MSFKERGQGMGKGWFKSGDWRLQGEYYTQTALLWAAFQSGGQTTEKR